MIIPENIWQAHSFECSCGQVHSQPIKDISITKGALDKLGAVKENLGETYNKGFIIIDSLLNELIGDKIKAALDQGGILYSLCLFDSPQVLPNETSIVKIMADLDDTIDFMIAVGSGAVNDLARFISSRCRIPYISIPTAASMDGYSAEVSLLVLNGIKKTLNATHPTAIYADTSILKNAPPKLVAAGFGDLICKKTAAFDWRISNLINGESYCQNTVDVVDQIVEKTANNALKISERDETAIKDLAEGLMLSGIAMHWVGKSRPAAGAEHHLAHFIGMKAMMKNHPVHLHGIEVAVMTLVMIEVYHEILSRDFRNIDINVIYENSLDKDAYEKRILEVFKDSAPQIFKENENKIFEKEAWLAHAQKVKESMPQIKEELIPRIPDAQRIISVLTSMGAPAKPEELGLTEEDLKEAILYAKEVRNKYTILDAAEYLGCLEDVAEKVAAKMSR
ncbi:sn-glycerol-1-phosphate dehydrogenase [Anoxybacterium hadale]|uniref:Sn-glycerol-1-phosphate dehydrogenase n=1 Tax=Anoxybacterium hadale TaxID=3408580 RepID=A0ACD1A8X1_9FIRM|nr:sn-glycerol-1-phosphate dehydrogenase [Clostridiales bacterium]